LGTDLRSIRSFESMLNDSKKQQKENKLKDNEKKRREEGKRTTGQRIMRRQRTKWREERTYLLLPTKCSEEELGGSFGEYWCTGWCGQGISYLP